MTKHKIQHRDFTKPNFPELCPHCLALEADHYIELRRIQGIPGIASETIIQPWPVCRRCHAFHTSIANTETKLVVIVGLVIAAVIAILFYLTIIAEHLHPDNFVWVLPGSVVLIIVAAIYVKAKKTKIAHSVGLPFAHLPIKLIRGGKQILRKGRVLEVLCYHTEYALAYQQANEHNGQIKIKPTPRL